MKRYTKKSLMNRIDKLTIAEMWANTRDNFVDKHIGKLDSKNVSDSDLIHRAVTTKKDVSAFTGSRDDVLNLIKAALTEENDIIVDWVNDMADGDDWVCVYNPDIPIGRGFYRSFNHTWNAGACNCSEIHVVLRKTYNSDEFRIVTAYPVPTDTEKEECIARSVAYDEKYGRKAK